MRDLSIRNVSIIKNILSSIDKINIYTVNIEDPDSLYENAQVFDAVLMNFIAIGEMAGKISDQLKDETKDRINWQDIKDFRNVIAHNYFGIDAEEVWQIILEYLPRLEKELSSLID